MKRLWFVLWVVGAVVYGIARPTWAQPDPESLNVKLTPEMINRLAADLRIPPTGRHMRAVIEAQYRGVQGLDEREEELVAAEAADRPILFHLRSTNGLMLPAPEDLPPLLRLSPDDQVKMAELQLDAALQIDAAHQKLPELPKCTESRTTRESTGVKDVRHDDTILFDMLFLPADKVPLDPDEVFGQATVLQPYTAAGLNGLAFGALGVGVTCLPTRLRATKAYVYRDEGANALKNYDGGPHGKGKVHPKMRDYIESF